MIYINQSLCDFFKKDEHPDTSQNEPGEHYILYQGEKKVEQLILDPYGDTGTERDCLLYPGADP